MIEIDGLMYKVITIYRTNEDGITEPYDIYEPIKQQ
jgi:hypothetical protein